MLRQRLLVIVVFIRRLFARPDPVVRRLNRLRRMYRSDSTIGLHTRRVRDVLRGHVASDYHTYYDRLLRIEQAAAELLHRDVRPGVPDLLPKVYALTERVARLIDQLQRGDKLLDLYPPESVEQEMVAESRRRLIAEIDEALTAQEGIPARLIQISTASAGRDFNRLRTALTDLSTRLEGMADSYDHLSIEGRLQFEQYKIENIDSSEHQRNMEAK
jgi:hypothetical protein